VLSSLETARGNGDGLDEVTISLLVAAKNEELFYDISRWGEDVGVASKATFSRMKNELEDTGLIETEKVPVDVGRPRQRLTIKDDRLKQASSDQIAAVAESILN
jgi:predicted transcriptional regulator